MSQEEYISILFDDLGYKYVDLLDVGERSEVITKLKDEKQERKEN